MKKILLLISTCYLAGILCAQNHELSLSVRGGNSHNYSAPELGPYQKGTHRTVKNLYDKGIKLLYSRKISKKNNLFYTGGIEYSKSSYYLPLYANSNNFWNVENILIDKSRITLHPIGLKKRFELKSCPLSIDLGATLVNRIYLGVNDLLERDYEFVVEEQDWFDVAYSLETFYNQKESNQDGIATNAFYMKWNFDFNLQMNYDISSRLQANLGFNYSRNNIFFYNYEYSVRYYYNDSPTPNGSGGQGPLNNRKYGVKDHFFYLNTGLTYKFQKREKKKLKE